MPLTYGSYGQEVENGDFGFYKHLGPTDHGGIAAREVSGPPPMSQRLTAQQAAEPQDSDLLNLALLYRDKTTRGAEVKYAL